MRRSLPLTLLCSFVLARAAAAQFDLPGGVALSPFPVLQTPVGYGTFDDGRGGVWAFFLSDQPGSALYGQHVLGDGSYSEGYGASGLVLAHSGTLVNNISAVHDGLGGASLIWFGVNPNDSTSPFLALRYSHREWRGTLAPGLADTGVVVSSIASAAMVASDGAGGAYVVWEELKGPSNPDIYAQHYDYAGHPMWTPLNSPSGRPVCAVVGIQRLRAFVTDQAGGAYVVWTDSRGGTSTPLYVARLLTGDVAGSPWVANGELVTPITTGIRIVGAAPSSTGGLWLAWRDIAITGLFTGQHVGPDGSFLWGASGSFVATTSPPRAEFVPAANGHVFVTWGGADVRCSRLDAAGVRVWTGEPGGRVLATPTNGSLVVHTASDGAGGQRLAWADDNAGQSDVVILGVDGAGAPWPGQPVGGEPFETGPESEIPVAWFPPNNGAPLLSWLDAGQLRVRRLPGATVGVEPAAAPGPLALSPPAPNPFRGAELVARFTAPPGEGTVALYDVEGRRVSEQPVHSRGGSQSVSIQGLGGLAPGVYTLRLTAAGYSAARRIARVR